MDADIRQMLTVIFASTVFVVCVVAGARAFGLESQYLEFLLWAQNSGMRGYYWTAVLLMLSVIFLLPSIYLTMGAGLLFGVVQGSILVVVAETIGALIAYYVGRTTVNTRFQQSLMNTRSFSMIDGLVGKGGWELIAATRMVPFFPFKLSNYAFGISSANVRDYLAGTFLGLWPIAVFNAYLGSIAGDVMSMNSGLDRTRFEWFVYLIGFAIVLLVLLVTARIANRRLKSG